MRKRNEVTHEESACRLVGMVSLQCNRLADESSETIHQNQGRPGTPRRGYRHTLFDYSIQKDSTLHPGKSLLQAFRSIRS
jgi:hypothetical protein